MALINEYNVFGTCWRGNQSNARMGFVSDSSEEGELMTAKQYTPFLGRYKNNFRRRNLKDLPPCAWGGPIVDYFRNPLVLSQLNIDPKSPQWDFCSDISYQPD